MTTDACSASPPGHSPWVLLPALPAAALLYLSFFPISCGWLGWIALVPLLGLVRSPARPRRIYGAAYLVGLAFYGPVLQWFRVADARMYVTWIFLTLYCALYFPVAIGLVRYLEGRARLPLILTLPVVWVALEFFRSTFGTGFSWYLLGHTQHDFLESIQIADITGAYGVSFFVVMVNALIFEVLYARRFFRWLWGTENERPRWSRLSLLVQSLVVVPLLGMVLLYGVHRLSQDQFTPGPRLALLQSNLPQNVRNDADEVDRVAKHNLVLSDLAAVFAPDLIVWPETSFPRYWEEADPELADADLPHEWRQKSRESQAFAKEAAAHWRTAVLLGLNAQVYEADGQARLYNSAVLIDGQGQIGGRYDKIHRVPLGEYVPLRGLLPFMNYLAPYDFDYSVAIGRRYSRLPLKTAQRRTYFFGVVICYEDTDPEVARNFGAGRAATDFLVNISNDGWFKGTSEHEQHLAICRFRAVECRCPVARSVNMGISAAIDANGKVLDILPMPAGQIPNKDIKVDPATGRLLGHELANRVAEAEVPHLWRIAQDGSALPVARWSEFKKVPGVLLGTLPLDHRASFYAVNGDWLPWTCWVCLAGMLGIAWGKRRN